ncbi:MAG: 5'-3' exonuclease H3TH domain-containing protein [Acidobacteriota bacterium]
MTAEAAIDGANHLLLIDASPFIFRSFFALPEMTSPDGAPVHAVYGFGRFLLGLDGALPASHAAVAFDGSLTTSFRNDLFPAYKAQRELPPADLEAQLDACFQLAEALGFVALIDDRYEADDLLATIHERLRAWSPPGDDALRQTVVTTDKDLAQLVDGRTTWRDPKKDAGLDVDGVIEAFGVRPSQIADYLALVGDRVDNIPGVPGIGAKTAAALLGAYDDLEALLANPEGVASLGVRGAKKLPAKLADHAEQAHLSKQLATVAVVAPLALDVPEDDAEALYASLARRDPDADALRALTGRLGLEGLASRALGDDA